MNYKIFPGPLGNMIVATRDGQRLAGVWFEAQKHAPDMQSWTKDAGMPLLCRAAEQLQHYLGRNCTDFDLPLDLSGGTAFQQSVWNALRAIPRGAVTSYADLARRVGKPLAARAVGAAVGRNPLSVVVPCHRVLGTGGALTGYAGGLPRKTALLQLEGALT